MTEEEINNKGNEEFLKLLERTKNIKNIWEVYTLEEVNKNSDKNISKKLYTENFLMASILDAFISREFLNLKELLAIIINEKTPEYFLNNVSVNKIYLVIIEMIKLGYIETYKEEKILIPIFQITKLGIVTLQQRTLQNLALTSFYSYQTHKLDKKAIFLSLIALCVSIIAIIISIIIK